MFKIFFASVLLVSIFLSSLSQAQEMELRNGKRTILIDLDNDNRDQEMRIRRLERAVRDLQEQVWQLNSQPIKKDLYVCQLEVFMKTFKSRKHNLEYDAKQEALSACTLQNHEMHCSEDKLRCQKVQ